MAVYDAFISYSHAKDKPIAAALQSVVQRLGKPWYQRRALRIFRDDTSLTATPHLWPSIEQALGASRFLILMASPEAAASPWVGKEIAYWLEHKSVETLLIALTDGTLTWSEATSDFAWTAAAPLPAVLKGAFGGHEPKWVDLTAYRLKAAPRDPKFEELAADFAAVIRGMPKEDLLSEEVHQQRSRLRLAYSAAFALLVLAVLAVWQSQRASFQRDRAETALAAASDTADKLVFDLAREFRNRPGMPADLTNTILERVVALQRQLARSGSTPDLRRLEAVALTELSEYYLAQGDGARALDAIERSLAIARALAAEHPDRPFLQRELAITLNHLGDARRSQSQWPEAIAAYREALAIVEKLAALDPNDLARQRDLWLSQQKIADVQAITGPREEALATYRRTLVAIESFIAKRPDDRGLQVDLAFNHNRLAIVLEGARDYAQALEHYRLALSINEQLARAEPDNTSRQRDVFLGFSRVAGALTALGQREDAIAAYRKALAVMAPLAASDPGNVQRQQDLIGVHDRLDKLLADGGDRQAILAVHQGELAARERLAAIAPSNMQWQYDLAVTYLKVGHDLMALGRHDEAAVAYRKTVPIFEKLLEAEPDKPQTQGNLSLGYLNIGAALAAAQKWSEASAAYDKCIEIRQRLAASDPTQLAWQRDLALALEQRAASFSGAKDFGAALRDYQTASVIRAALVKRTSDVQYRRELVYNQGRVGDTLHALGRAVEAREILRAALAMVEAYAASDPQNALLQLDLVAALSILAFYGDEPEARYARAQAIVQQLDREGRLTAEFRALLKVVEQSYGARL